MLNGYDLNQDSDPMTTAQLCCAIQKFYDEMQAYHESLRLENEKYKNINEYEPNSLYVTENLMELYCEIFDTLLCTKGL